MQWHTALYILNKKVKQVLFLLHTLKHWVPVMFGEKEIKSQPEAVCVYN